MKRAQSTQLSLLKRVMAKRPEAKKPGRASSPAFDEAFEAAQRAQVVPLRPPPDAPVLQAKPTVAKEPQGLQARAPQADDGRQAKTLERRPLEHELLARREANAQQREAPATFTLPEAKSASLVAQPAPVSEAAPVQPPRPVDPANALLQLALHDASLTLDVSAQVVRVALETEAAGALNLEVRVHENRADLRVEGPASPLVVQNEPALREVLSSQGLSLGDFSLGQGRHEAEPPAHELPEAAPSAPAPTTSVTAPSPKRRHDGRIDVKV